MQAIQNPNRGSSPSLALVHPTEAEKLIQSTLNGVEWRGALSLAAYLRREEELSQLALTKDSGITYWMLVDTLLSNNPLDPASGTRLPLASCETLRKKALVCKNGEIEEVICHGVASVFCATHLRKRGYAQRMMQELGVALRHHQTNEKTKCLFSVLYSDIGKKFYDTVGWEPFPSYHVSIPAQATEDSKGTSSAKLLYAEDLDELCRIDTDLVRQNLQSRSKNATPAVALLPDLETIQWHHAREDFIGRELCGEAPKIKGAMVGSKGGRSWCYWTRMWYNEDPAEAKGNKLHILRLVSEGNSLEDPIAGASRKGSVDHNEAAVTILLRLAQNAAATSNMEQVEIWTPTPAVLAAAQQLDPSAKLVERDSASIASLQWFGERDSDERMADKIDWIGNEKYGWC